MIDAVTYEPDPCAPPEPDGGDGLFVVEDFAVSHPGVVIDGGVNLGVPDPRPPFAGPAGVAVSAAGAPPAA